MPFVEQFAKTHPIKEDYGKTWTRSLPDGSYWYEEKATGAVAPEGWNLTFPDPLRAKAAANEPDAAFYEQWASSPFADTYLTRFAETAVDSLGLSQGVGTDFLGISYSSVDYVGNEFGPRSWEIQDVLVRLDKDLADLFAHLDKKVGRGKYVVALSADHGVAPIVEDMQKTGADVGVLHLAELQDRIEKALEPFNFPKPAIARINGSDLYFAPDIYEKLRHDDKAMRAVVDAALGQPGVAEVFRAEQVQNRPATQSPTRSAFADSYFPGPSGDLFIVPSANFGYGVEFAHLVDLNRVGGFVVKGLSREPIEGDPAPRLCETPSGMLNAVGLQNVGVRAFVAEKLPALRKYNTAVLANVFGYCLEDYVEVIRILEDAEGLAGYELNISCPNVKKGGMQFGSEPAQVAEVVAAARKAATRRPLWVKLSPLVADIGLIARAAQNAGADALTVANTYPAMAVDVRTLKSRLGNLT